MMSNRHETKIIRRDENGFGLRVSGDNPVKIESVKHNGAAWKAGVRAGHIIIKVNGEQVLNRNHLDVVKKIQENRDYVSLTLSLEGYVLPNSCPSTPSISPPPSSSQPALASTATSSSSVNQINRSESLKTKGNKRNHRKISDPALTSSSSISSNISNSNSDKLNLLAASSETLDSDEDDGSESESFFYGTYAAPTHPPPSTPPISHTLPSSSSSSALLSSVVSSVTAPVPPPLPPRTTRSSFVYSKRMEIINELFSTEKTHVEYLEVLNEIFYQPISKEQLLTQEQIQQIFSTHDRLLKIHKKILHLFEIRRKEYNKKIKHQLTNPIQNTDVPDIYVGDLLDNIFEGDLGSELEEAASVFCASQTTGLEILNKMKKDSKFALFLSEAESHERCKRLDLKALLAFCFQRLTKYPLLLDSLLRATPRTEKDGDVNQEFEQILKALHRTREILHVINESKRSVENRQRLRNVQRKMVKQESWSVDLTEKILVHEGYLTLRISKQKCIDMLAILCTDVLVLLTRDGDRFVLKSHTNPFNGSKYYPILDVSTLLTRNVAVDKTAFFLLSVERKQEKCAVYELAASTATEKDVWTLKIQDISQTSDPEQSNSKLIDLKSNSSVDEGDDHNGNKSGSEESTKVPYRSVSTSTSDDLIINNDFLPKSDSNNQLKNEGTISYVSDDYLLIPPKNLHVVDVSARERVGEAVRIEAPEARLNKLDISLNGIIKEKINVIQEILRVKDQREWTIINDISEHDEIQYAAALPLIQKAMELATTLALRGAFIRNVTKCDVTNLKDSIESLLYKVKDAQESRDHINGSGLAMQ